MSESSHRSTSKRYQRESRSCTCCKCQEKTGRKTKIEHGRRDLPGTERGKSGWGRQGAVQVQNPLLRRVPMGMSDRVNNVLGGLFRRREINPFARREVVDPSEQLERPNRMDECHQSRGSRGGLSSSGKQGAVGEVGGGGEELGNPGRMTGRSTLNSSHFTVFIGGQHRYPILCPYRLSLLHAEYGIGMLQQENFPEARQNIKDPSLHSPRIQPPSFQTGRSFDVRGRDFDIPAMEHPRLQHRPFQGSARQLHNRFPSCLSPYAEDYERSEMEAEMAQRAAIQQMIMARAGGNPYFFDVRRYGEGYAGLRPTTRGEQGSVNSGRGKGTMGGSQR